MVVVLLGAALAIAQVLYLRRNPTNPIAGGRYFTAFAALGASASAIIGYLVQDLLGLNQLVYNNKIHQNTGNHSFILVYNSSSGVQAPEDATLQNLTTSLRIPSSGIEYWTGLAAVYLDGFVVGVAWGVTIGVLVALARPISNIRYLLPTSFTPYWYMRTVGESTWSTTKHYFRILPTILDREPRNQNVINLELEITRSRTVRTASSALKWTTESLRLETPTSIAPKTHPVDTMFSMGRWCHMNTEPVGANLVDSPLPVGSSNALEPLSMVSLAIGSPPNQPSAWTTRVRLPSSLHAEGQGAGVPTTEADDRLKKKRRRSKASQIGRLKRAAEYAKKKEALNIHGSE